MERAVVKQGTAIKATTAGRNPLKAFSTQILSCIWVKHKAIANMMRKEGSILPKAQMIPPGIFFNLYPTKMDMFTANIPGRDWAMAKRSMKSSLESQPRSTTSR